MEFLVEIIPNNDFGVGQTIHVVSIQLKDSVIGYRQGYYQTNNNYCTSRVNIDKTSIALALCNLNGNDVSNSTIINVYAK